MNSVPLMYFRGRVALSAILRGLGIGQGDQVAIQAFTCVAVPEAVFSTGATPLFIDIESQGFCLDTFSLAARFNSRVRAILVQHTFGIPTDMTRVMAFARQHGIPVIEDCCHSLASTLHERLLGEFGAASFRSFEIGKPLVAGLGGSATVHDAQLRSKMEADYERYEIPSLLREWRIGLQHQGSRVLYRPGFYWNIRAAFRLCSRLGLVEKSYYVRQLGLAPASEYRLRIDPGSARRLPVVLQGADRWIQHSRWVTSEYERQLHASAVMHPQPPAQSQVVYSRYPLRVANKSRLLEVARKAGVELADWYATPVHPLTSTALSSIGYEINSCPQAELRSGEIVSLPVHLKVSQRDINRVCAILNSEAECPQQPIPLKLCA